MTGEPDNVLRENHVYRGVQGDLFQEDVHTQLKKL